MVQFSNPAALWLLTLTIPVIVLYLLKRKRILVEVPSLLIWRQAIEDTRAQTPFQKLKTNLLLFLQLLIITIVTAILAQPHLSSAAEETRRWILVMDISAGMKATDVKPDRLTDARNRLLEKLAKISSRDQVMLIAQSAEPVMLHAYTSNKSAVESSLKNLKAEDIGSDWNHLFQILIAAAKQEPKPHIVIASDFAGFPSIPAAPAFEPIQTGNAQNRAGIVRASATNSPENPDLQQLFFEIQNFSSEPMHIQAELSGKSGTLDVYPIDLKPRASRTLPLELEVQQPLEITLRIDDSEDVFQVDNDFTLRLQKSEPIRVSNRTGNIFLTKALAALPNVSTGEPADVIFSTNTVEEIRSVKGLGIYFAGKGPVARERIVQWNAAHPVMRFVDAGLWQVAKANTLHNFSGCVPLVEIEQGPVICAIDEPKGRKVIFGFSLEQSNVVLFAGFPVFLQNALEWIARNDSVPTAILTDKKFPNEGYFKFKDQNLYANFLNRDESDIFPASISGKGSATAKTTINKVDLTQYFLMLLLALVILEWYAFHRKMDAPAVS